MSLIANFRRRFRNLDRRDDLKRKGVSAIEFALTLPIWCALLVGTTDVSYMMIISQRVDRISYSICDIITQSESLTTGDLDKVLLAASQLMQPFPFSSKGRVIVTSVYMPTGGTPTITWQYAGGGTLSRDSKIGNVGETPTLPNDLTLNDNENLIITETYYAFEPMFINAGFLHAEDLYRVAVYKPRLSSLIDPPTES